jgi:UDP-3-O-[3-hydroxymyristoyl] glucosamine N-acyltransferase
LGNRVVIHDGSVIGADGFGFTKRPDGTHEKVPQVGIAVIEDDVEIQANACVDRATLGETRIGRGTKIDNLVQVGHNCVVGENTILCSQVGLSGSTVVGKGVTLAGQVGVAGHLTIGDGVTAIGKTGISSSLDPGLVVSGTPAIDARTWMKYCAVFPRLPDMVRELRDLRRRLEALEGTPSGPD